MAPNRLLIMWSVIGFGGGIGGYEDPGGGGDTKGFWQYYLKHVANIGDLS